MCHVQFGTPLAVDCNCALYSLFFYVNRKMPQWWHKKKTEHTAVNWLKCVVTLHQKYTQRLRNTQVHKTKITIIHSALYIKHELWLLKNNDTSYSIINTSECRLICILKPSFINNWVCISKDNPKLKKWTTASLLMLTTVSGEDSTNATLRSVPLRRELKTDIQLGW